MDLKKRLRKVAGYAVEAAPYTGAVGGAVAQHFFGVTGGLVASGTHYASTLYLGGVAARGKGLSGSAASGFASKAATKAGLFTAGGAAATGLAEGLYTGFKTSSFSSGLARGLGGSVDPVGLGALVAPKTEKATGGMITSYDQLGLGKERKTNTLEDILTQMPGQPKKGPPTTGAQPPGSPQNNGMGNYGRSAPIPGETDKREGAEGISWGWIAALGVGSMVFLTR